MTEKEVKAITDKVYDLVSDLKTLAYNMETLVKDDKKLALISDLGVIVSITLAGSEVQCLLQGTKDGILSARKLLNKCILEASMAHRDEVEGAENEKH